MSIFSEIDAMKNIESEENVISLAEENESAESVTESENTLPLETFDEKKSDESDNQSNSEDKPETSADNEKATEKKAILPKIKPDDVPVINYDDFKPIFNLEGHTDDEIINAALNRLMQDTYFGINGMPLIACFLYVYNKARKDAEFCKKVLIKSKNFTKAFDYLNSQVKSMSKGNRGVGLDHRQIFAILDDYYDLDDAAIAEKEAKARAKEKAKLNKADTAKKTVTKSNKSKKATEKPKEEPKKEEKPLDLFSLLGGSN